MESHLRSDEKTGRQLPLADVLQFSWQIADSLSATHAKGIIRRDLKPQNVMLVADSHVAIGNGPSCWISVWPRCRGSGRRAGQNQHQCGDGTPLYMSPEQCDGAGKLDGKTDVYALGVMMYEMLCGRLPFEAEGHGRVMLMHMTATPGAAAESQSVDSQAGGGAGAQTASPGQDDRPTMRELAGQIENAVSACTCFKSARFRSMNKTTAPMRCLLELLQSTLGPVAEQTRGGPDG